MQTVLNLLPLLGIVLLFWLLLIRPQQRRNRELRELQYSLSVGDEVILTSGIIGTVRSLDETEIGLEVAPGTTLRVARAAVGGLRNPESQHAPEHDADEQAAPDAAEE